MNGLPPIVKERPPEGTRRVLLTVSYDGTAYAGWQWQDNALSVQQVLEEALARLTGKKTRVTGASRTDAGVHALGQRAHFDTASRIPPDKYPFALNTLLPPDIRVLEGFAVPADFHARFDARGKRYTYRIYNAPHASALMRSLTAHVPRPLDMDLSLIHISEPTRQAEISYAVFCLKKKKQEKKNKAASLEYQVRNKVTGDASAVRG